MTNPQSHRESVIVGYVADGRGYDALEFAGFLARESNLDLIITMVMPVPSLYAGGHIGPFTPEDPILAEQLQAWETDALSRLPEGVNAKMELRYAHGEAHGLLDAVAEHDASMIIVGAKASPLLRAFTIGSVANALLHAASVPVALVPNGYEAPAAKVTRITGIYGAHPGSEVVIGRAVQRSVERKVPLRLLSLVQVDQTAPRDQREVSDEVRDFGGRHLQEIAIGMLDSGRATIEIAEGESFEDALRNVEWVDSEVALLGSSRLAKQGSVFLGQRARRILGALPVPAIVLPSSYQGPRYHESPTGALPIVLSNDD
ncbi:universal stress protein [Gulosibacter bifidus]|uniref:Universal stress protein n=1 Tax=Gulosibacter bifidus TaxID=272239 RepID=A0ABW5RHY0_9MICO|nr:universal stress protein [Gulosibacter bifidus]